MVPNAGIGFFLKMRLSDFGFLGREKVLIVHFPGDGLDGSAFMGRMLTTQIIRVPPAELSARIEIEMVFAFFKIKKRLLDKSPRALQGKRKQNNFPPFIKAFDLEPPVEPA